MKILDCNKLVFLLSVAAAYFGGGTGCHSSSSTDDTDSDSTHATDSDTACRQVLTATFRDFTEAHPDFERDDSGWGPAVGLILETLDEQRKPIYNKLRGDCKLNENGTCPSTDTWQNTPMWGYQDTDSDWQAEETFFTWYRNDDEIPRPISWFTGDEINRTIQKEILLEPNPDALNSLFFDSSLFLPLDTDEGFGPSPENTGENYLFTTEIHTQFDYVPKQVFTFRGDDDLWIFVNDKLALDLGGLHEPFEGTIDFDALAEDLEIVPGNRYPMDIFHAERHSPGSNFRIETNISCFVSVVPE
ncbi:MAG: fibro-slime domain-containing protein [Deltaproteobacteria bacterium]|nr:fibro-slime domain-containing protein [Deltaproteobacteria bacterium]MBN2674013.1 fibro-slime domain-containing protein [Deltaproteobacteria bacterium]